MKKVLLYIRLHREAKSNAMDGATRFESKNVALQKFVRARTPRWLSQFLDISIDENVPLEDLFADCWVLGRVADVANSLLKGGSVPVVPKIISAKNRPHKKVLNDMERFQKLCDSLRLPKDSRIDLADVLEHRSAVRVALCLWACSDALHKALAPACKQFPQFASPEEVASLYKSTPREVNAARIQIFEKLSETNPTPSPEVQASPGRSPPPRTRPWKTTTGGAPHTDWNESAKISKAEEDFESTDRDLLSSLLLRHDQKPSHLQLLTSIMRSDGDVEDSSDMNKKTDQTVAREKSENAVLPETTIAVPSQGIEKGGYRSIKHMSFLLIASVSAVMAIWGCNKALSKRSAAKKNALVATRRREVVHQGRW